MSESTLAVADFVPGKPREVTTKLQQLFFDTVNGKNPSKRHWLSKI